MSDAEVGGWIVWITAVLIIAWVIVMVPPEGGWRVWWSRRPWRDEHEEE